MTKVAIVEWPDGLLPGGAEWETIRREISGAGADLLVTNEMPFGHWLPKAKGFDRDAAARWVDLHEEGLQSLKQLDVPSIISSRPVMGVERLANEAFALEGGRYTVLHHKHLFPAEPGWEEADWFRPHIPGFETALVGGLRVGVLLCTELMFSNHARDLGRKGVELIVAPRATGENRFLWQTAATMAAVSAGAYVATSNRWQPRDSRNRLFGGGGFAVDPAGQIIATTQDTKQASAFELDPGFPERAKVEYPAYVDESYARGAWD
ncbi:carbon-nitrogen hydrolase family protein [Rhizobium sp. BK251]|uniref:carbon-nitrogen hydrolase family protein n=1 Tax=Rhizobium sp. BK251 TaxID=2512125 RepID=UPI0010435AB6|nr:carbon-nitrogen hydrolase family protein [Rhizobium sp. BK251]TCL62908.1 N-carbamoylputrescine amidase [Rhizobium sp. BK251]